MSIVLGIPNRVIARLEGLAEISMMALLFQTRMLLRNPNDCQNCDMSALLTLMLQQRLWQLQLPPLMRDRLHHGRSTSRELSSPTYTWCEGALSDIGCVARREGAQSYPSGTQHWPLHCGTA